MTEQMKIGLIGYGGWPRTAYVPALHADGRSRVVAVAAPSEQTRARARSDLGDGVATYPDAASMLAEAKVDALMIAVAEHAHASAIGTAIEAALPVMYEPPLTDEVAATPAMVDKLIAARAPTHADIELSFLPVLDRLAAIVASGEIGVARQAEVWLSSNWGASGQLCSANHLAPWFIDPLDRVLDARAQRVLTLDGSANAAGAQPQCLAVLDYNGVWATFRSNNAASETTQIGVSVTGSSGEATADLMAGKLQIRTGEDWRTEGHSPIEPILGLPGMHESVRRFLDAIEAGAEDPLAAGSERLAALARLGLAIEESKLRGDWAVVS